MKVKKPLGIIILLFVSTSFAGAATQKDYSAMYDKCIAESGTINNGIVATCSSYVSQEAKKEMADLYISFHDKLLISSQIDAASFEASQKSWLTYRNKHCTLAGQYVGSPMHEHCPMQLNIERVMQLRELVGQ